MSELRVSKLAGTVEWDDGTNFNGYAKFDVQMPADGAASEWDSIYRIPGENITPLELPQWAVIPITDGIFHQAVGLIFNADMIPYNSKYQATYYDVTLKEIAGPTASFIVSAEPTTPPVPTLPAPVAPA